MTNENPTVGIIMGSDSDFPIMEKATEILDQLGINFEVSIVSAHRTPDRMFDYAKKSESRGLKAIIAGAGGAAHLPGMVASLTLLPVIGVPISVTQLNGQDSLLSIVQMPFGVPVATMAINNAGNAGLLAAQIIGLSDETIRKNLEKFRESENLRVHRKAKELEDRS
ncbi:MAG: 5-(carboxyamino)imidazole ribonucleotide mutase [Gammaproteobacteria bacterium]|nr:5-(carboxyamino)imidazole ribonucleotide mutase [Gammaproteobacteria bacterium]|tara:strand:- start:8 stop:508 length:501 start_codon:yes stop_codon:yes gene_type:complete